MGTHSKVTQGCLSLSRKNQAQKPIHYDLKKLGDCVRLIHDIKDPRVPSSIYSTYLRSVYHLWILLWVNVARNCDCLNFNESPPYRIKMNLSNDLFADTRSQTEEQHDLHIKCSFLLCKGHRITTLPCCNVSFISKRTFGSIRETLFRNTLELAESSADKIFHNFQ
jgi:hypothetical protein